MPSNPGEAAPGSGTTGPPGIDATKTVKPTTTTTTPFSNPLSYQTYAPTAIDKQFLIWSGRYKSKADIPNALDKAVIDRARSWGRIRINLGFMVVAVVGAFGMVYMGKDSWRKGDTVINRNMEWHRKIKEEHESTGTKT